MELKDGIYISKINKIFYKQTSTGKDMICVEFEITDEESENFKQKFYMNQFINTDFGKKLAKDFYYSLQTGLEFDGTIFDTEESINNIGKEVLEKTKLMEFDIKQTTKGVFKTFQVVGIYDLVPEE